MKKKEICTVISQECIANDIYSMWIQTDEIAGAAVPGQFVSLYTGDPSRLLPRPISLCEIDGAGGRLRLVYRVTGKNRLHIHAVAASGEEMEGLIRDVIDPLPGIISCSCNTILSRIKDIKGLRL